MWRVRSKVGLVLKASCEFCKWEFVAGRVSSYLAEHDCLLISEMHQFDDERANRFFYACRVSNWDKRKDDRRSIAPDQSTERSLVYAGWQRFGHGNGIILDKSNHL